MITKKIVLVGDFSTGKTSLIRRYVDNEFSDDYLTTIGVKISKKILLLEESDVNIELQLMIWDIEGNTDSKPTNPAYIMGAHGLIIVADITRNTSIKNIKLHIEECQKVVKDVPKILVLNKSDLIQTDEELQTILQDLKNQNLGVDYIFDSSAKDGKNVEKIFSKISETIITRR